MAFAVGVIGVIGAIGVSGERPLFPVDGRTRCAGNMKEVPLYIIALYIT